MRATRFWSRQRRGHVVVGVAVLAILVASASCVAVDEESGSTGLSVGAASAVIIGRLDRSSDDRLIEVVVTSVLWGVGERYNAGLGRLESVPAPVPGDNLRVRSRDFALPSDTDLIMFLAYVFPGVDGQRPVDFEWALQLVLDPDTQQPLQGTPTQTVEYLARILYRGEDPTKDTVGALIEYIQEEVERVEARHLRGVDNPPLGPRTALLNPEVDPAQVEAARLQAFLDTPPGERQLSEILTDLPVGADRALGVEWSWREVLVVYGESTSSTYGWIGLEVPGVGILGPVLLPHDSEFVALQGYGVAGKGVEVIAWRIGNPPQPGDSFTDLAAVGGSETVAPLDAGGFVVIVDLRSGRPTTQVVDAVSQYDAVSLLLAREE